MRLSAARSTLTLSAALGALALAGPALAQPQDQYEYAEATTEAPVVFHSEEVVQPVVPAERGPAMPPPPLPALVETVEIDMAAAPLPPPPLPHPAMTSHAYAAPAYGNAYAAPALPTVMPYGYGMPTPAYGHAMPHHFDRDRWLTECHERIRGVDRKDRAGVIGGLLGAALGGVIGNRAWDSERLAGTLLGAGVGGLAGVAIGNAVGAADERRHDDECAYYLDRHMVAAGGYGYPGYGYGYGYGGYAWVPVMVAVPQRAVVRETVTEEWVDEPAREHTVTRSRVIHRPAAHGDKRIKITKGN